MMLHGASTPKRTTCYSNMPEVHMLDRGKLSKSKREAETSQQLTSASNALANTCAIS